MANPDVDHPLVEQYRALHFSSRTNNMIYLSAEHKLLLLEALNKIERAA